MVKDYRVIASGYDIELEEILSKIKKDMYCCINVEPAIRKIVHDILNMMVELADDYEELEADYDEQAKELNEVRKERRVLKTCYMQHIETIAHQRNKINELENALAEF